MVTINIRTSLFLDLLRLTAAAIVVFDHAPYNFDIATPRWGHSAVIFFFVISGFVISHTAMTRETTARSYAVARLGRLWSVVIPALMLTAVLDYTGSHFSPRPEVYNGIHFNMPAIHLGAAMLFLSETWVSIQPFSNGVFWSLCCEFWYYVAFGVWQFMPAGRRRTLAFVGVALLAGQKAILLAPIWLMGVYIQRAPRMRHHSGIATLVWAVSFILFASAVVFRFYDPFFSLICNHFNSKTLEFLGQARLFWLDWIMGLLAAAHIWGALTVAPRIPLERFAPVIRWLAGLSFASYLFHMPLYFFFASWMTRNQGVLAITLVFGSIALIGPPVERSKRAWGRAIEFVLDRVLLKLRARSLA